MLFFQLQIKLYFNENKNCLSKKKVNANYSNYLHLQKFALYCSVTDLLILPIVKGLWKLQKILLRCELNMNFPKTIWLKVNQL